MSGDRASFALITGAGGGIGGALVRAFQEAGYQVIATDMVPPTEPLPASLFLTADLARMVTEPEYSQGILQQVRSALDGHGLKVLINNAALQVIKPAEELTIEDWTSILNVNTVAPFLLIKALMPELEHSGGSVINISSIHATLTKPGFVAYSTSKAAISGMTRSLAVDFGHRIRVNSIAPAAIGTRMLLSGFTGREKEFAELLRYHPAGRIGQPEDVAALALFLSSDSAAFITGSEFPLDGGIAHRLHDPV
jgi:NAD(P)-dependent dehydrogenase (short-subunit alcohol dehydrogenase family)